MAGNSGDRPGGEPTEEPTPKRLREARARGQIAQSRTLTSAAAVAAAVGALVFGGAAGWARLSECARRAFDLALFRPGDGATRVTAALAAGCDAAAAVALPVVLAAAVAAAAIGALQAGGLLTLQPIAPDAGRLSPVNGLKRVFSLRSLGSLGRSLLAALLLGVIAFTLCRDHLHDLLALGEAPPSAALAGAASLVKALLWRGVLVLCLAGAVEYLLARRSFLRDLRMTREELRRELKEEEGDPHHKHARKRLHEEILRHDVAHAVAKADCVIVNPDHIAVALRFDRETMSAPTVVAKGERLLAEEIKRIARRAGVPVWRDVPLARALNGLEIGGEIPEELYDTVAEVLRFVYRLGGRPIEEEAGA